MAGTPEGGRKAAKKNLENNPNFYKEIGQKGGLNSSNGGFASEKVGVDGLTGQERARIAGARGGHISKRRKKEA